MTQYWCLLMPIYFSFIHFLLSRLDVWRSSRSQWETYWNFEFAWLDFQLDLNNVFTAEFCGEILQIIVSWVWRLTRPGSRQRRWRLPALHTCGRALEVLMEWTRARCASKSRWDFLNCFILLYCISRCVLSFPLLNDWWWWWWWECNNGCVFLL